MAAGFPGMAGIPNLGRGRRSKLQAWLREARADGPVAMWVPGTTQSGTTLQNLVNPGTHDATLNGGVTTGAPGPHPGGSQAFDYDGVDDYLGVPYAAALNPAQFTVEAWINCDVNATGHVVSSVVLDTVSGYYLRRSAQRVEFLVGKGAGAFTLVTAASTSAEGSWLHAVGTFDGTTPRLFVNGASVGAGAATTLSPNASSPLDIGRRSDGFAHDGKIGGVAIYNTALSAARIAAHYRAGV